MNGNLNNQQTAPEIKLSVETSPKNDFLAENRSKPRDFLVGFFFSLAGGIILELLDLLFIAKANPKNEWLMLFLVFLWPLLIFGLYVFFLAHFFKIRRWIFWGILASFFSCIVLAVLIAVTI